jgi:hypothetical protein
MKKSKKQPKKQPKKSKGELTAAEADKAAGGVTCGTGNPGPLPGLQLNHNQSLLAA